MKTVWKYQINADDNIVLDLPVGTEVLSVQEQFGDAYLWCLVDPNEFVFEQRTFRLAGTGHPIKENNLVFIGTLQLMGGRLVFHLFEVK